MKIAMIFPGYTSQFVGMGKELYDESRIMQEYFEQASHCLDLNFVKLCFASSDVEIGKMHQAYPALFLVTSSIAAILKEAGIKPQVIAGCGIGQYAAIHTANGLTFADGLYLLSKLSLFSQELFDNNDFAVARIKGCSTAELQEIVNAIGSELLKIACFELPNQHVVSGSKAAVETCMEQAVSGKKVKAEFISIEYGLHSSLMLPVVEQFEVYFEKVDFKTIDIPLIANSSAQPIMQAENLKKEVIDSEVKPIAWLQVMQSLYDVDVMLLIGPGNQLHTLLQQLYPNRQIMLVQKPADIELVKKYILGEDSAEKEEQPTDETIIGS